MTSLIEEDRAFFDSIDWEYAAEYMNENQIIRICTFCQISRRSTC